MLFGKFRILGKLALLVLVPLLGVVALSVPIIVTRVSDAQDAQDISDRVALATRVGTAVQELQEERLLAVGYRLGLIGESEMSLQSARAIDAIARIDNGGDEVTRELRRAVRNATKLDNTRQNVFNRAITPDVIVTEFTDVITPMINGLALASTADLKTGVGRQVFALEQALRTDDMISQASGYLTSAVLTKNAGFISLFYSTLVQLQQVILNAQSFFTDSQYKLYLGAQDAFNSRVGSDFLTLAATDPNTAVGLLNIKTLFPSLRSVLVLGGFVEKRVAADVQEIVTNNRDSAIRDAFLIGGGSLILLLLVVALSLFMARAVARPLRRLTVSADRIARAAEAELERVADDDADTVRPIRLDPVDVEAQDEIGDLARAFDRVQTTAVRLVERQVLSRRNVAQMFAHVGRRTQNLVGRQLALIDNLERRETDSDRLGELYRLDHMSSRLRRNASSLVVLSGGAGANEHMAPLPLVDVVRLALAEIEDYTRVDIDVPEDVVIVPAILADLTLLLAELMENATAFSPPHTRVAISVTELRGGARLAIIDQGLGMPPEKMAEENARLTRRERLDLAPSEVLGLFVVGRLARRHGIEVTLTDTPGGGVTVWIDLTPAHLIARVETVSMQPPAPFPSVTTPTPPAYHTAEFAQVAAASAARASVPGSQMPFDPNVLSRATQTLETGGSWNAFAPIRTGAAVGSPVPVADEPVYEAEPVYSPRPAFQQPTGGYPQTGYDLGAPIAGRVPEALPELPAAGGGAWGRPVLPAASETAWTAPPAVEAAPSWNAPAVEAPAQPYDTRPYDPRAFQAQPQSAPPYQPQPQSAPPYQPQPQSAPPYQAPPQQAQPPQAQPPQAQPPQTQPSWNAPSRGATPGQPAWNAPSAGARPIPRQRVDEDYRYGTPATPMPASAPPAATPPAPNSAPPLRRRVPGSQLPAEGGSTLPTAPPSQGDADAARAAFDAFEAGVSRANWDVAETHMSSPPSAGHPPLARRVPGATLPKDEPNYPPPASPALPLDPDAARALMEQFEYGVALALNETQPQHEGQPR